MKIPEIFLAAVLLLYGALLQGKSLVTPPPPVSVTEKPNFGPSLFDSGPTLRMFRWTNRTLSPLTLQISAIPGPFHHKKCKISHTILLPGNCSRDTAILLPRISNRHNHISFDVRADIPVEPPKSGWGGDYSKIASASFTPDFFTYVLDAAIRKAPLPVKEWPADSCAYAGLDLILLDSEDTLSPELKQALRLAAARGTRILVLVRGENQWPAYAGTEQKGRAFEEKIGFGTWIVMRTQAVDTNPAWKEFVKNKHNAVKSGTASRRYKNLKWKEKELFHYLHYTSGTDSWMTKVKLGERPVPIRQLTWLMLCFVILIGPVNILVLRKYRAELWSIVTIPALSLFFSGAVILSVFMMEGFSSRGKGEVETILDQTANMAASRGGFGIYSPLDIGDFKFAPDDMLYFYEPAQVQCIVTPESYNYKNLVPPRMSFSYAVCRSEERSEKIAVTEKAGAVSIVNGLGVKVDSLFLRGSDGKLFKLDAPLAPGARAVLKAVSALPVHSPRLEKGFYRARVSEPLFISPGVTPDQYEHKQTILGRWR